MPQFAAFVGKVSAMKQVNVKNLIIGNGKVTVQSMTNLPVTDIDGTLSQINRLAAAGCDIVRIAVPNKTSAEAFAQVRLQTDIPLVADIHFDYRLAIAALEGGADKVRINPGNMPKQQLVAVIDCAKKHNAAIRIGVNAGSVPTELIATHGGRVNALSALLTEYVAFFEQHGFEKLVLSVKSSDVREMVAANRLVAKLGYPMHLGVTEAGPLRQGIIKNSVGIGSLLFDGIGDTIRVSLTADPVEEVYAARDLLVSLGLGDGVRFVSCPKCGRCTVDLERTAEEIYAYARDIKSNVKIAVMGCEVNGPGECRDADLGIAGANGGFVFFKKGKVYKTVPADKAIELFKAELKVLNDNR